MSTRPGPSHPPGFDQLFESRYVAYAHADTTGTTAPPDRTLVHRVHVVGQPEPGLVTVCESREGWRFLPGGRLEPGETVDVAVRRELMEEAGSEPVGPVELFFSHVAASRGDAPYLPHAPHPVAWWTYGVCPTRVVGTPTVPEGAEQVVAVHHLPVDEAVAWLAHDTRDPVHGEVVRLAAHLELLGLRES